MQNLEAYQNLELQKQVAKIQITGMFQGYLKKVLSLSTAQQVILQKAGIHSTQFDGISGNNRNPLLQPAYYDPATIFGPSLALLNSTAPQIDSRTQHSSLTTNNILQQNNFNFGVGMKPQFNFQNMPGKNLQGTNQIHSQPTQNVQPLQQQLLPQQPQANTLLELPPLPFKQKLVPTGSDDLNDFFHKKISNASTNCSFDMHDEEIDTGKKIRFEKVIHIENPGQPTQKARKRTKVLCGHPWKSHHAKGLCKNCYETFGKTRKPWKCEHSAHFAKGYCKKCYLRLRQKISVKDIFPFAIEQIKKRVEKHQDAENLGMQIEPNQMNIKEEAE